MTANDRMSGPLQLELETRINHGTSYRDVPTRKMPLDAWVYQELIAELRPDVIVEVGNYCGGSLLYLADLCNLVGHGFVLGVDITHDRVPKVVRNHPRVDLITGDALAVFGTVRDYFNDQWPLGHPEGPGALVIEDSAHTYDHTLAVLRTYGQLVQPGGYLICEDGVMPDVARALAVFTDEQEGAFAVDRTREWPLTWNPGGYLRRLP